MLNKKTIYYILLFFALVFSLQSNSSIENNREPPDTPLFNELNHIHDEQSLVYDLVVRENLVYVADGYAGITIYDYTDKENPAKMGQYQPGWFIDQLVIEGSYAFLLANGETPTDKDRVLILDISDPNNPSWMSTYSLYDISCIAVNGTLLYIGSDLTGIEVLSIQNPSYPQLVTTISLHIYFYSIRINASEIFVATYHGPYVFDMSDINNPVETTGTAIYGKTSDIVIDGKYLYLFDEDFFRIVDYSDRDQYSLVEYYQTLYPIQSMEIMGKKACFSHGYNGISIIEYQDIMDAQLRGYIMDHHAYNSYFNGTDIFVAGFDEGIYVLNQDQYSSSFTMGTKIEILNNDIALLGDYLFVAEDLGHLYVFDVSDPLNPSQWNFDSLNGNPEDLYVDENVLIVSGTNFLTIFEFGDNIPEMSEKATIDISVCQPVYDIEVTGNDMYVANACGLKKYDISNRWNPIQTASLSVMTTEIKLEGDLLYCRDYSDRGLVMVDLMVNPSIKGMFKSSTLISFDIAGNKAYLLDSEKGLVIVDVSDPQNPKELSNYLIEPSDDIYINGSMVYVVNYVTENFHGHLYTFDVSDPYNPKQIMYRVFPSYEVNDLKRVVADGSLFIASDFDIYPILQENIMYHEPEYSFDPWSDSYVDLEYKDELLFTASFHDGLRIYDMSDVSLPISIGTYISRDLLALDLKDNYCFLLSKVHGLEIVDISNPSNPSLISRLEIDEPVDVSVDGSYVYILKGTEMKIFDISQPEFPSLITSFGVTGKHIYAENGFVYLSGSNKFEILDVSDLHNIVSLSSYSSYNIIDAIIDGDYAYLANGEIGLTILDISLPTSPRLIASIDSKKVQTVTLSGNYAYLGNEMDDVFVVNCTDFQNLEIINSYNVYDPKKIEVYGNYTFVADSYNGIRVLEFHNPTNSEPEISTTESTSEGETVTEHVTETQTVINVVTSEVTETNFEISTITETTSIEILTSLTDTDIPNENTNTEESPIFISSGIIGIMVLIYKKRH
ncbi:MAG: hypothetical protein INQ03_08375 [Candidatus Heimdallarchaeota archaeon]|nr:hypothetical protein [Candidatus Heimdallarchaeota archaeon]